MKKNYLDTLHAAGFSAYLHGFSAIDSWLGRGTGTASYVQLLTNAGTADLARIYENIRYPGMNLADAALDVNEYTLLFTCADHEEASYFSIKNNEEKSFSFINKSLSFKILDFYQNCQTGNFHDPRGIYPLLAALRANLLRTNLAKKNHRSAETKLKSEDFIQFFANSDCDYYKALTDASLILAAYLPSSFTGTGKLIKKIASLLQNFDKSSVPSQEEQRFLLTALLTYENPEPGFELLKASGFIGEFWRELAVLDEADHSKEFHPEGNAWKHTMETFRYRKISQKDSLLLSLALLLHDTGKPIASSSGSKRFDGHAELGEMEARRFLERLGFHPSLITDVCFLVRNHMITAALPRLPLFRTEEIMSSRLFPLLLELYRCDESSSFKGLNGYYESSAVYKSFLRNRRNPYRSTDGKKRFIP